LFDFCRLREWREVEAEDVGEVWGKCHLEVRGGEEGRDVNDNREVPLEFHAS
jgi:hypothetical protein